jgi:3-methyl-2-oxobutanoate hydroxymethyltransferase
MSLTRSPGVPAFLSRRDSPQDYDRISAEQKLRHEPITCLTAYDYTVARLVDEAGIDMVLVGDSLAQTMLGYENTLSVTMDEMLHHVKAVRRGVRSALLVADMPYGSYQVDPRTAIMNATRFVKEGGAEVVKIEGGEEARGVDPADY